MQVERIVEATGPAVKERRVTTRIIVDVDRADFEWGPDVAIAAMHVTDILKSVGSGCLAMHKVVVKEDGTTAARLPSSKVDTSS